MDILSPLNVIKPFTFAAIDPPEESSDGSSGSSVYVPPEESSEESSSVYLPPEESSESESEGPDPEPGDPGTIVGAPATVVVRTQLIVRGDLKRVVGYQQFTATSLGVFKIESGEADPETTIVLVALDDRGKETVVGLARGDAVYAPSLAAGRYIAYLATDTAGRRARPITVRRQS